MANTFSELSPAALTAVEGIADHYLMDCPRLMGWVIDRALDEEVRRLKRTEPQRVRVGDSLPVMDKMELLVSIRFAEVQFRTAQLMNRREPGEPVWCELLEFWLSVTLGLAGQFILQSPKTEWMRLASQFAAALDLDPEILMDEAGETLGRMPEAVH